MGELTPKIEVARGMSSAREVQLVGFQGLKRSAQRRLRGVAPAANREDAIDTIQQAQADIDHVLDSCSKEETHDI